MRSLKYLSLTPLFSGVLANFRTGAIEALLSSLTDEMVSYEQYR